MASEQAHLTRSQARLTCRRVSDDTVLCQAVDKTGRTQVEFRRAP